MSLHFKRPCARGCWTRLTQFGYDGRDKNYIPNTTRLYSTKAEALEHETKKILQKLLLTVVWLSWRVSACLLEPLTQPPKLLLEIFLVLGSRVRRELRFQPQIRALQISIF